MAERTYDWQRPTPPPREPNLRFDTHFQNDGLAVPVHPRLLVAVSGGGDSMALLHLLNAWRIRAASTVTIKVASVDHGLRAESADEARFVEEVCAALGLSHSVLSWMRDGETMSQASARGARYDLLHRHALSLNAGCILLGHTLDDQAETVAMRAARGGRTNGLAGMAVCTSFEGVDLYRPLLGVRRAALRDYLASNGLKWIDDPSNENLSNERIRVRRALACDAMQDAASIARFASLCGRSRAWMSEAAAELIDHHAKATSGTIRFSPPRDEPYPMLERALAAIVNGVGGGAYALPHGKLRTVLDAFSAGEALRFAVGRTLIEVGPQGIAIAPEISRDAPPRPATPRIVPAFDAPLARALDRLFTSGR